MNSNLKSSYVAFYRWPVIALILAALAQAPIRAQTISASPNNLPAGNSKPAVSPVSWPLPEPFAVSDADLAHGELQTKKMLHDRPEMARYVNQQSPIWQWCVRQFAGASLGQRILWNNRKPKP